LRNPYAILGLKPDADEAAIKAAYRRLAKSLHPDAQTGEKSGKKAADAQTRFQEVTAAYNLLKDKGSRQRFDAKEAADAEMQAWSRARNDQGFEASPFAHARGGFQPDMAGGGGDAGGDIFSGLFGGLRGAGKRVFRARGEDRVYKLTVSFLEAARGGKQRVTLADGRSVDVKIPAGIEDGQQIRLRGQGGEGHGGAPAGDALMTVSVAPHDSMKRDGLDILLDLPISLPEAVLGAKLEVETLSGPVALTIPAGSNTGTRLRLKGRGIALENGAKKGDQYVTLSLRLPDEPDRHLRDFVSGWGQGLAHDPRQKPRS
tara:strand:- start:708 stop:1655 length:948 start_codon:yes stop_codon:yes gene_type:complete